MKHSIFFSIFLASLTAYSQVYDWTRQYKGTSETIGIQALSDATGNVYVVSHYYYSNPQLVAHEGWTLQKYNQSGSLIWTNNTEVDFRWHIALDQSDRLYLFGSDSSGNYLTEIDRSSGVPGKMNQLFKNAIITGAEFDRNNSLVVAGVFQNTVMIASDKYTSNGITNAIFVASFDATRTKQWVLISGGNAQTVKMKLDHQGNVFLAGNFWNELYIGNSSIYNSSHSDAAGFITKLSPFGHPLWLRKVGRDYTAFIYQLTCDAAGNLLVAGGFNKPIVTGNFSLTPVNDWNALVMKTDPNGNTLWVKQFSGTEAPDAVGVSALVSDGESVFVGGGFNGSGNFGNNNYLYTDSKGDAFLTKLDENGQIKWLMQAGAAPRGRSSTFALAYNNGYLYTTGTFSGNAEFGEPSPHYGQGETFVSRITDNKLSTSLNAKAASTDFRCWPNPTRSIVEFSGLPSSQVKIDVFNLLGELSFSGTTESGTATFNVSSLKDGVYSVKAEADGKIFYSRIIKTN